VGIIREKADSANAKVMQDRDRQTKIPAVRREAQRMICSHRIEPVILQRVSLQFGHQADATTFLILIDQHPRPSFAMACMAISN